MSTATGTEVAMEKIDRLCDVGSNSVSDYHGISSLIDDTSFSTVSSPLSTKASPTKLSDDFRSSEIGDSSMQFSFNENNSSNSLWSEDQTSFLSEFNHKFGVVATSLSEVIELVETLLEKQSKKNTKTQVDTKQIKDLQDENRKLQEENDKLRFKFNEITNKVNNFEHKITNLNNTNISLLETNKTLKSNVENLENALSSLKDEMENQITDLAQLGQQRAQLITIANKHTSALYVMEELFKNKSVPPKPEKTQELPAKTNKKKETSLEEELYSILCTMVHIVEENLSSQERMARNIRDQSQNTVRDRILNIVKHITKTSNEVINNETRLNEEIESLKRERDLYHTKAGQVLKMFEDQLQFLSRLPHSQDLQHKVFYQDSTGSEMTMTEEDKSLLYTRCAKLGRFVEETIGVLSDEKFYENYSAPEEIDPNRIFDLLQPPNMESSLEKVLHQISSPSEIDSRQIFDMFAAEVFINNLLKNHITELTQRIAHNAHEIAQLRQEVDDQPVDDSYRLREEIERITRRMLKIRDFLSNYVDVNNEIPTLKLIKKAIATVQSNAKPSGETEAQLAELKQQVKTLAKERNTAVSMIKKERKQYASDIKRLANNIHQKEEELSKAKEAVKEKDEAVQTQQNEFNEMKKRIECNEITINELKAELEKEKKTHEEEVNDLSSQVKSLEETRQTLSSKNDENLKILDSIKKQRTNLGKKIERLSVMNRRLSEENERAQKKMKDQFTSTINELQSQYQSAIKDLETEQQKALELGTKNQQMAAEIAKLNVERKTLDMKLRSLDQKAALEQQSMQSRITAQVTAAQIEQSSRLNSLQRTIDTAYNTLLSFIKYEVPPENLLDAISAVEDEMKRLSHTQYLYLDLMDDISTCQRILGIGNQTKISSALSDFVKVHEKRDSEFANNERKMKRNIEENEKIRKDMKRVEGQIVQLKQWESWAKRIHRVIHESESVNLSMEELRLALEEALLASVSHRSIFYRIESLRAQKNILAKFEKRALSTNPGNRATLRTAIIITLATRRIQKMGGFLPITNEQPIPKAIDKISETPKRKKSRQSTKKPTPKSSRGKTACRSPLKPLIPLWI